MKKVLVTGGTAFVSKYVAQYHVNTGNQVTVINRNNHAQIEGVNLIEADRLHLSDQLKDHHFDLVLDITAYTGHDVDTLLDALGSFDDYVLISSSAVYPENTPQPFNENAAVGFNSTWTKYGTDKIDAENALIKRFSKGFILRPPYIYGPMNNAYREAFVFDCANENRPFCLPKEGKMPLQFFHINDLCKFIDLIVDQQPSQRIFNVGNASTITVKDWVQMCYRIAGKEVSFVPVDPSIDQRTYFCFYDYTYYLDVSVQDAIMPEIHDLYTGLKESYAWYMEHAEEVKKRPYLEFIDGNMPV